MKTPEEIRELAIDAAELEYLRSANAETEGSPREHCTALVDGILTVAWPLISERMAELAASRLNGIVAEASANMLERSKRMRPVKP